MSDDGTKLAQQLKIITAACRDYDEMQLEILTLLGSYTGTSAVWTDDKLKLYREDQALGYEEYPLAELCLPLLILLARIKKEKEQAEQEQAIKLVKAAINTLSYTELDVVLNIFKALGGTKGVLVAGKIADGLGITRSVVVSALRKLESARIIETRSLGVKGTYIKILNPLWLNEIRKLKV